MDALHQAEITPDKLHMVDSTVIRAHLRVNGAGLPMRTEIMQGQEPDYTRDDLVMADNLPQPAVLVADRDYASDKKSARHREPQRPARDTDAK